ncbi:MAG TPA: BTAD domain-containing putative transcriptional regulator, partial [Jatrophihabitantaceae bacterium]|nr:BTAD domain-containing putative transcriptional regulator [Jatrophihabitantaceae bacterium]
MVGGVPTIRVLGPVDAEIDGARVDLGGPRQRAVLALLVIASGRVVSVDKIIDDLWHGEPPPRAIGALQAYISNLRRALEPGREPRAPAAVLVSAAPGYAVRLPVKAVDAWSFENQVLSAAELADRDRYDTLDDALRLWNGSAFAQFAAEPWVAAEAARLQELHLVAREQLVDAAIRVGATAHATAEAERLVVDAPLREEGWRLLALVQYLSGRQADALATLRRARERLADELGVDPGPALQQLERDILNQVVAQLPPIEKVVQVAPTTAAATSVFIGRNTELGALLACAERAQQGHPAVAVISGEPGVGKSAILSRLHEQLSK